MTVSLCETSRQVCAFIVPLFPLSPAVLPSQPTKRQSLSNRRQFCQHPNINETCQFYSHCIESLFPCGPSGFILAYAEKRCNSIRLFRSSDDDCDSCLKNAEIVQWTREQEQCFKQGMYDILTGEDFQNKIPDPVTCLLLERKAIDTLQTCSRPELCTALEQPKDIQSVTEDLLSVVEAFRVNEYYGSVAERALSSSVSDCNGTHTTELAESLISEPPQLRVVFCATITAKTSIGGPNINDTATLQSIVRNNVATAQLHRPIEQFVSSGIDVLNVDSRCFVKHPKDPPLPPPDSDYYFLTWFPSTNDSLPYNLTEPFYSNITKTEAVSIFVFESASNSLCGNGIRDASELCDLGVYNGDSESGCTNSCLPVEGFDCSVEANQPSFCWKQECGDGRRTSGEGCDDGDDIDGNGCSSSCQIEPGFHCSTVYNTTSQCEEIPPILEPTPTPLIPSVTPTPTPCKLEPPSTSHEPPTTPHEPPPTTPSFHNTAPVRSTTSSQSRTAGTSPSLTAALALGAVTLILVYR